MNIKSNIERLRKLMKQNGIDAYIISDVDPHQSEYVAEYFKMRSFISGFTGSAGTVVITMDKNGLWADGRYHIQAEEQLKGSGIDLFKQGLEGVPTYTEWLKEVLDKGSNVGFDGKVISQAIAKDIIEKFKNTGINVNHEYDFIKEIWNDRGKQNFNEIYNHDIKYAGKSTKEKLQSVREKMKENNADYYILGSLDNIAWLFNIRGTDVPNNPVVYSYALVSHNKATIYLNKDKLNGKAKNTLEENKVEIKEYEKIAEDLNNIAENANVFLDESKINRYLYKSLPKNTNKIKGTSIATSLKSIKNDIEIKNLKGCQIRDGVAMVRFIHWLKENVAKEKITEIDAIEKLENFRRMNDKFKGISFDTIAGYKDHAAMMHYKANKDSQYTLEDKSLFLIDSGGQYLDGTTDITRTIALGDVTEKEKSDFTLVLKSHIALDKLVFLYGTTGSNIDIIARKPMWENGLDYKCGTGHGVGFFLNVHEGPQSISRQPNKIKLEENMILTNEPGIYRNGEHGIRIENTIVVKEKFENEFGKFMDFETISYCPIDLDAIEPSLLDNEEKKWLNDYHKEVYSKLSPYLEEDLQKWLENQTREI
ncbi:aminopeptidase P family protein [Senegalia massiliensis]|uniref:Aminopeptidase P family protein n=1 Tax=Senegalia massiliensis TaxID=1720316 RepID=A0A845R235_9CLOT|nr:aminopeptidase P family protein [Senegalia massiliensis]NBI07776.1 aminopeptidase P family protein [Senegalia massiliensis]